MSSHLQVQPSVMVPSSSNSFTGSGSRSTQDLPQWGHVKNLDGSLALGGSGSGHS